MDFRLLFLVPKRIFSTKFHAKCLKRAGVLQLTRWTVEGSKCWKMMFLWIAMGGLRNGLGLFGRRLGVFWRVGDLLGVIWNLPEMTWKKHEIIMKMTIWTSSFLSFPMLAHVCRGAGVPYNHCMTRRAYLLSSNRVIRGRRGASCLNPTCAPRHIFDTMNQHFWVHFWNISGATKRKN